MQTPQQIFPDQWEVINGEARPKNEYPQRLYMGYGDISEEWQEFEQFATQHIYKAPGIPDGTYKASELVFKWQFRYGSDDIWDTETSPLSYKGTFEDYIKRNMDIENIEFRQIIALAESEVTPPASPLEGKETFEYWSRYYDNTLHSNFKKVDEETYIHAYGAMGSVYVDKRYMVEQATPTTLLSEGKETVKDKYLQDMTESDYIAIFQSKDGYHNIPKFTSLSGWATGIANYGKFTSWDKAKSLGYDVNFTLPIKK